MAEQEFISAGSYVKTTTYKLRSYNNSKPNEVSDNDLATVNSDMPVQTSNEVKANRPDIIMKD